MEMKAGSMLVAVAALLAYGTAGADPSVSKVMGSIDVSPGQHAGEVSTVNGSIHIGENAVVGKVDTVNGSLTLGKEATAASLDTVNGSVELSEGAHVAGTVATVNGSLRVADGADIGAALTNVNGSIRIRAAHVGGSIETTNADIDIGPNAHIDGGIHMNRDTSWWHFFFSGSMPRVVIGPGSVVRGPLHFERAVTLYVSDHASIGPVTGATVTRFAGANPPG
jgi:cytoskeletal protein CcmA (bactofilin family)